MRSGAARPPCSGRGQSWSPRPPAAGAGQETQEGALVFQGTTRRDALCRAGKERCRAAEDVSVRYTPCSGRAIFKPKAEAAAAASAEPEWLSRPLRDAPAPTMSRAPLSCFWDCGSTSRCCSWRRSSAASGPLLPVSRRVSLPGGFPQNLRPSQGHSGAGSCWRASAGNRAFPAPRTTS